MTWATIALLLFILIVIAFVASARRGAVARNADPMEEMDADSRSLFGPIRRLADEIEQLAKNPNSVAIRVVGTEASEEARRIRDQIARALAARSELKKAARGRGVAEAEVQRLETMASDAASEAEKEALKGAKSAREIEVSHYRKVAETISRIDAGVRQAEAALSEMKTRLSVASGSEKAELAGDDELRDTIGRLRSLSVSYDEAEQTLKSL